MRIYRLTDRIPVKIGEVTFWLAPLSYGEKTELLEAVQQASGEQKIDKARYTLRNLQMSVKEIEGVEDVSGPYQLEFDQRGHLTDDCMSEVLQLAACPKLMAVCSQFALDAIQDFIEVKKETELPDGKKVTEIAHLDGVEIDLSRVKSVKKK